MIFSSDAAKGVCIMILAAGVMSMNDAVSKYLVESYPIGQILCLRQAVALLVILLYVWRSGAGRISGSTIAPVMRCARSSMLVVRH